MKREVDSLFESDDEDCLPSIGESEATDDEEPAETIDLHSTRSAIFDMLTKWSEGGDMDFCFLGLSDWHVFFQRPRRVPPEQRWSPRVISPEILARASVGTRLRTAETWRATTNQCSSGLEKATQLTFSHTTPASSTARDYRRWELRTQHQNQVPKPSSKTVFRNRIDQQNVPTTASIPLKNHVLELTCTRLRTAGARITLHLRRCLRFCHRLSIIRPEQQAPTNRLHETTNGRAA